MARTRAQLCPFLIFIIMRIDVRILPGMEDGRQAPVLVKPILGITDKPYPLPIGAGLGWGGGWDGWHGQVGGSQRAEGKISVLYT